MATDGLIATSNLNTQLDAVNKLYRRARGTVAAAFGLGVAGSFGAADSAQDLLDDIYDSAYVDVIEAVGPVSRNLRDALDASKIVGGLIRNLLKGYDNHARLFAPDASVVSLDTLLTYLNTDGGTWTALQDAFFRDIYFQATGRYPTNCNLYQEILQGTYTDGLDHLYTNGMGKCLVTGAGTRTFTKAVVEGVLVDGGSAFGSIDSTKYAGGFPQLRVSGLTGTGDVTVTGIGFDPATGAVTTSKTWITNVTGNGVTALTPGLGTAPTGSLIIKVTDITIAAGISAGTIYMEAARPSGRPLIN